MTFINKRALVAVIVALVTYAQAAPADTGLLVAATVEGIQLPAWVERSSGSKQPLSPGLVLRVQDKVITGDDARLLLRLADGSTVKLGPKAQLVINGIQASRQDNVITLRAALNVLTGAFRFTTSAVNKLRSKREVDIRFSTATAGIRGTDLWGAQRPDREIFCLIEGNVGVERELNGTKDTAIMDQPLQFFVALKDKPTNPIGSVSPEQIVIWKAETEIGAERPVLREDGKHKVVFMNAEQTPDAFRVYDELRAAGYPATLLPVQGKGKHTYQVHVAGLESEVSAKALLARFPAYEKAYVTR